MTKQVRTKVNLIAIEVSNFGKAEWCFKPTCETGEKLLQVAISRSRKPDSKRTSFSEAMLKDIDQFLASCGKPCSFPVVEVKNLPIARAMKVGDNALATPQAASEVKDYDLSFLA